MNMNLLAYGWYYFARRSVIKACDKLLCPYFDVPVLTDHSLVSDALFYFRFPTRTTCICAVRQQNSRQFVLLQWVGSTKPPEISSTYIVRHCRKMACVGSNEFNEPPEVQSNLEIMSRSFRHPPVAPTKASERKFPIQFHVTHPVKQHFD